MLFLFSSRSELTVESYISSTVVIIVNICISRYLLNLFIVKLFVNTCQLLIILFVW